jgi:hypothetical protein
MRHPHPLALLALVALAACSGESVVGGVFPDVPRAADATMGVADASSIDVPTVVDASRDVSQVDVMSGCSADGDCTDPTSPVCDPATRRCVGCVTDRDTCPRGQYCEMSTRTCARGCDRDDDCVGATLADGGTLAAPRCDVASRGCVACVTDAHCPPGNLCVGNLCVAGCSPSQACPAGATCCNGACVDPQASAAHCGGCGRPCALANATPACLNGTCAVGACAEPFADCDRAPETGCEANTRGDVRHCGGCDRACASRPNAAARCEVGACRWDCAVGFSDCDGDATNGCETDTRTSLAACGACGRACALPNATARCEAGSCAVARCADGYGDCDGVASNGCETDLRASVSHCGRCGEACPTPPNTAPSCAAGRCASTCAAGRGECDGDAANGCEVELASSVAHCGACGRSCRTANVASATCAAAACAITACADGFGDCDGNAANGCELATSANNAACGRCGNACGPGARCAAGVCVQDCRRTGAVPCGSGTVCDFTDGRCVPTSTRCALAGAFASCGAQSCGPGAACNPRTMRCDPALSCRALSCEEGTGRCWGSDCPCDRPPASCATITPSSVPSGFLSGAFGFDIDDGCNLYTATMLSGPDYVRRLSPAGVVSTWTSVANLNMGEVAVQRRANVGSGTVAANVAFTYICCAACGCASNPPQGVGHVQGDGSLPVVVPAVVTSGAGPFGVGYLDTGPYGLAVSSLGEFFVGNVRANGDWYRYDTDSRMITAVASLPGRITASTAFDLDTMLVAAEGGALYLVERAPGGMPQRLGTLGSDVQSIRRDAFTGRLYASLRDRRLVSFAPDLSDLRVESTLSRGGRVAISPDGWLYVLLSEGGPVSRIQLPTSR